MPNASDMRPKPAPTPRQQAEAVARRPQVLTWLLLLAVTSAVFLLTMPLDLAIPVIATWVMGGLSAWLAARVR